jgi:recombination associated protein RdgC
LFKAFRPFAFTERNMQAERPAFVPCEPRQAMSLGFVNHSNGEAVVHGVELVCIERKTVPGDIVKRATNAAADKIEQETGRRPKGKRLKELKEEALDELLIKAFPKRKTVPVMWLDDLVLIGSTSKADVDAITTLLSGSDAQLALKEAIDRDLGGILLAWARESDDITSLLVGRNIELQRARGSAVFKDAGMHSSDVVAALQAAEDVKSLRLIEDRDGGAAFTLTHDFAFKGVDIVSPVSKSDHADAVSADCFFWRTAMQQLLATVREALDAA